MQLQAPGRNRTCGPTIRATPIELINYVASSLYALKPAFIKDFKKTISISYDYNSLFP